MSREKSTMAEIFEKLGLFYLGKTTDPASQAVTQDYLLYDSKDLVTHAVCVGMTGSGKTGLCIALLEEAAIFDNRLGLSSSKSIGHFLELGEETIGLLWDKTAP